jgi:hypothetical protein
LSTGKIEVHSPQKLESQVLHKYFRHSKFASFQRQLNYFGFRKLAGKGKMAPCSYVNDDTTLDLRSLLLIKRKASLTQSGKEKTKRKRDRSDSAFGSQGSTSTSSIITNNSMVNPVLAGILQRTTSTLPMPTAVVAPILSNASSLSSSTNNNPIKKLSIHDPLAAAGLDHASLVTPQALAQAAVGRGIKHGLRAPLPPPLIPQAGTATSGKTTLLSARPSPRATTLANAMSMPAQPPPPQPQKQQQQQQQNNKSKGEVLFLPDAHMTHNIQESLSQLTNNFRNSLNELREQQGGDVNSGDSEQDGGPRSISPGGVGLFMLSRNSSLVDLAMLDVETDDNNNNNDDDGAGSNEDNGFLMPFVDFPHQEMIPTDQQQQSQQSQHQDMSGQGASS